MRSVISPWLVIASVFVSAGLPQDTGPSFSAQTTGDTFLQCAVMEPPLAGFGVRDPKTHGLYAFWSIEADTQIHRVPMGVLGIQGNVKCHQPESGE